LYVSAEVVSLGQQRLVCHYAFFADSDHGRKWAPKKLLTILGGGVVALVALSVIGTSVIFTIEETVEALSASCLKFCVFASEVFVGTSRFSFYY
jgi:hypothetical protein